MYTDNTAMIHGNVPADSLDELRRRDCQHDVRFAHVDSAAQRDSRNGHL
jgi:hypothetical protein